VQAHGGSASETQGSDHARAALDADNRILNHKLPVYLYRAAQMPNGGSSLAAGLKEGEVPEDAIRAKLKRRLRSRCFARPPRCRAFLGLAVQREPVGRSYEICTSPLDGACALKAKGCDPRVLRSCGRRSLTEFPRPILPESNFDRRDSGQYPGQRVKPNFPRPERAAAQSATLCARHSAQQHPRQHKEITPWNKTEP
jgi:hypothetical protein